MTSSSQIHNAESQGQVFDSFREQRERYCLTQPLPPQPKRLRRELFSRQNLEVSEKVAIFAGEMTVKRDKLKHNRSQLYRQNEELEEEKRRLEDAGKLLLWKSRLITNIGNLVFAGVVIGGVFEEVSEPFILFGGGVLIAVFCYFLGYNLYKRGIRLWRQ